MLRKKIGFFKAKSASFSLGVKCELFNFPTILEEKGKGSSFNSAKKAFMSSISIKIDQPSVKKEKLAHELFSQKCFGISVEEKLIIEIIKVGIFPSSFPSCYAIDPKRT